MTFVSRILPLSALLLGLAACGDAEKADSDTNDCGEGGEWDEDHGHCHCDDGYSLTDGGNGCEPNGADDTDDTSDDGGDTGETGDAGDPFEPDTIDGYVTGGSAPVRFLQAKDGQTWLTIENHPDYGGATGPESRTLDAVDTDYGTCGVCLLLQTGCEPHGDHAHCSATYMPEVGGAVTFDTLGSSPGEQWSGSLEGIHFVEVEIGSDYSTTPVEGGDTFHLADWSFDVDLELAR